MRYAPKAYYLIYIITNYPEKYKSQMGKEITKIRKILVKNIQFGLFAANVSPKQGGLSILNYKIGCFYF